MDDTIVATALPASWPTWGVSMLTLLIQVFIKEVLLRKDNSLIAEV
jgi:hypothetical protein